MKQDDRRELLEYVGDLSAVIGFEPVAYRDGKAKGMRATKLKNGNGIEMTVLEDRCMDIPYLSFKGKNIGFVSKTGLVAPEFYAEDGVRGFLKSFNAGFLTTGGLTYAGNPCEKDGRKMGLHGPVGNIPAENIRREIFSEDGQAVLRLRGSMRQACVFDENMYLHREICVETEKNVIRIMDEIENRGFEKQVRMNVFHINFGYPMLREGCRLYFSADQMEPRDETAQKGIEAYNRIEAPVAGYGEQCFFHTASAPQENAFAMLHNEEECLAAVVYYNTEECPLLCEWKCMRAGDYALGLEPTNSGVLGLVQAEKDGMVQYIGGGETFAYHLRIELLEDREQIEALISRSREGKA